MYVPGGRLPRVRLHRPRRRMRGRRRHRDRHGRRMRRESCRNCTSAAVFPLKCVPMLCVSPEQRTTSAVEGQQLVRTTQPPFLARSSRPSPPLEPRRSLKVFDIGNGYCNDQNNNELCGESFPNFTRSSADVVSCWPLELSGRSATKSSRHHESGC